MSRIAPLLGLFVLAFACSDSSGGDDTSKGNGSSSGGASSSGSASSSGNASSSGGASSSSGAASSSGTSSSSSGTLPDGGSSGTLPGSVKLPPINGAVDYQLGGAYAPPAGVTVVSRDRNDAPAPGLYNICYVNGFQIQPEELEDWKANHSNLILKDSGGNPIIDQDWNEALIDVSTPEKRNAVLAIVGGWIDGCAAKGFDAVEIDNLDTFSRSQGKLTEDDCVAAIKLFADRAHLKGLAIAQKNSSELVPRKKEMGTDFVVAEECNRYDECDAYRAGYDDHVIVIEYRRQDFDKGCAAFPNLSMVLRDRNLVPAGKSGYVYDKC